MQGTESPSQTLTLHPAPPMIERHLHDGILTLRLTHGTANALDAELLQELDRELDAAGDARALVITGHGHIFCAGVDLFRLSEGGTEYVRDFFARLDTFVRRLFTLPIPVVAAANGHAIAGGGVIVFAADYRIMAVGKGRIGVPELRVGVTFPAAALEVVRFAVPPQHVQSLVYTGHTLPPAEALAHGLVDEVVPIEALETRARAVAEQMAGIPPEVFRLTKQALRAPTLERLERSAALDDRSREIWTGPGTPDRVKAYMNSIARR